MAGPQDGAEGVGPPAGRGADADDDIVERLRAGGSVFAEDEAEILRASAATGGSDLASMVARRVAGEPLQHIVGWADFAGHRVRVAAGVFVPRPRTEHLVDVAIGLGRARSSGANPVVIVDLCCGSGAVGLSVARALRRTGRVRLVATDVDPAAVACATSNLHHADDDVVEGDLLGGLPADLAGRVDLLLANVPYVPTAALRLLPSDVRGYESRIAHDGGKDGLDVLRRVAGAARRWLRPDGFALFEVADTQVGSATTVCDARGLVGGPVVDDRDGESTVLVVGPAPEPRPPR